MRIMAYENAAVVVNNPDELEQYLVKGLVGQSEQRCSEEFKALRGNGLESHPEFERFGSWKSLVGNLIVPNVYLAKQVLKFRYPGAKVSVAYTDADGAKFMVQKALREQQLEHERVQREQQEESIRVQRELLRERRRKRRRGDEARGGG